MRFGRYKDVTECGVNPNHFRTLLTEALACALTHVCLQVDFNSRNTLTAERQTFYCVPIPGENAWVKEISLLSRLDQGYVLEILTGTIWSHGFAVPHFE